MPKTFMFLLIGLFFGTGAGFLIAASTGVHLEGHSHDGPEVHDHSAHDHGESGDAHDHSVLTEADGPPPGVSLMLHPDGRQSRNLEIRVENFTFDPKAVNGAHVSGRGHAHVYVDGVKIGRAYGPWYHLSALPEGEHEVRVTLNANDHTQLAVGGEPVEAFETLVIE